MIAADQLNLARWVGTPYSGQRFCRALVDLVLSARGQALPAADDPAQAQGWQRVDRAMLGDVVVFRVAGRAAHVGICDGRGGFLHCEEGKRAVIERLTSPMWGSRIEGIYRCMK